MSLETARRTSHPDPDRKLDRPAAKPVHGALLLAALGVVYGDIDTSPIYTFRECLKAAGTNNAETVLGLLSLVFWSLTIVVTIKYVLFVMRAENDGEGGIMALLGLAAHSEPNLRRRGALILLGMVGAALFYGDGMITPAISVLSAVEGLEIATPALGAYVVPISVVVLLGLFLLQRRGSERIGAYFGPVMAVWFLALALAGLMQIIQAPNVLAALNPLHALAFFGHHGMPGFFVLGSVFLALTGAEALYADMGHFGRLPIRVDWFAIVLPALVLNYFGQGALILAHPDATDSPFYRLYPDWLLYPTTLLATAATVIASQAVISGAFSLSQQAMQLSLLPRLDIHQTSEEAIGQVYVPQINWLLAICVIGLVLGFQSSGALAAAYGIAVVITMLVTTCLLAVVARRVWGWSIVLTCAVIGLFLLIDLAFFAANIIKIPQGGWFPLLAGAVVFTIMSTWRRGRQIILERMSDENKPLQRFIAELDAATLPRVKGTAVYLAARRDTVPYAMTDNLRHNKVLHERVFLLTVVTERAPHVPEAERITVTELGRGITRMIVRFGFAERPALPPVLSRARERIGLDLSEASFFLGRETPVPGVHPPLARWRERLFAFMTRNAVSATDYFQIPPKRVVELGTQVEL
ncbi:MAG: potassium transporter Kup [Xanthobacteraceae bacterium]|nr:potassium transporter Kup [Xanthobacteraceae bacterium]